MPKIEDVEGGVRVEIIMLMDLYGNDCDFARKMQ
jgi:hypothetical protein